MPATWWGAISRKMNGLNMPRGSTTSHLAARSWCAVLPFRPANHVPHRRQSDDLVPQQRGGATGSVVTALRTTAADAVEGDEKAGDDGRCAVVGSTAPAPRVMGIST